VKKLEARLPVVTRSDRLGEIYGQALGSLWDSDLALFGEALTLLQNGSAERTTEAQRGAWVRWNAALPEAARLLA
jgi:hypothetical protein